MTSPVAIESSGSTQPQLFVFGGTSPAVAVPPGTGAARAGHGSPRKGLKARRRTQATQQSVQPCHHLVPLLVLRQVHDIPTLAAFSAVSQQFHDILSSTSGSVLWQRQLPALLAGLKAPKAPKAAGAPHNTVSTWQPLRLWSAATRLQCLKWLCSITTAEAINSPAVAQSLLQLFWTAHDIAPKELVKTLTHAGLRLTPELLLHGCQHQRLQRTSSSTIMHVLRLLGASGPQGWLFRLFAWASIGQFRDPGGRFIDSTALSEAPAAHTLDTTSPAYKVLEVLGVASWPGARKYLPGISIAADMLPLLLSMALCFKDRKQGDAMACFLCSLMPEPSFAVQHSMAHSASSSSSRVSTGSSGGRSSGGASTSSSSGGASTIRENSSGGCSSIVSSCGGSLSSRSTGNSGWTAADTQSAMLASLMQQCVADGRDEFFFALCQSPAATLLGPAALTDLLRRALRSPDLRKPVLPPATAHRMLTLLIGLPGASTIGPSDVADLLQEAVNSGTVSAEVLLQLPGARDLQAAQVLELFSAAVHANVSDNHAFHPRRELALALGRFAHTLPPDVAALVHLLKAAMDTPIPYSVLWSSRWLQWTTEPTSAFKMSVYGLQSMGLLAWRRGGHVLELLGHCAEKKLVWAWDTVVALLPMSPKHLADSDMHQLVAHYKAVVAAATATPPTCPQGFKLTNETFPTCPKFLLAYMQPIDWVEVIAAAISSPLGRPPPGLLQHMLRGDRASWRQLCTAEDVIIAAADKQQLEVINAVAAALPKLYIYHKPAAATAAAAAAHAAATAATTAAIEQVQQPEPVFFECEGDSAAVMGALGAAATATAAATAAGEWVQQQPEEVFFECEDDSAALIVPPAAVAAAAAGAASSAASWRNLPGFKTGARSWLGWLCRHALLFCPWAQAG